MIRDVVEAVLESGGYGVTSVASGTDALTAFEAAPQRYCALLTDIQLESQPNGWNLARQIRDMNPSLPVLYMSGGSAHEWRSRGADRSLMLAKPFSPFDVLQALSGLLAREGRGGPAGAAGQGHKTDASFAH